MKTLAHAFSALALSLMLTTGANAQSDEETDPQILESRRIQAAAEARTAAENARKAAYDAEAAANAAALAQLPSDRADGAVTVGENAGFAEARILNAQQIYQAASQIARANPGNGSVIILTDAEGGDLGLFYLYDARRQAILDAYQAASDLYQQTNQALPTLRRGAPVPRGAEAASGLGIVEAIAAVASIGGLFQRDIAVAGADITGDDDLLAISLASALGNRQVAIGLGWASPAAYEQVRTDLRTLDEARANADELSTRASARATLYSQASEDTENETWKTAYADIATRFQSVANRLSDALEAHKNFVDWLAQAGADDKPPPFDAIVRQLALRNQAANATVIVVNVHNAAQGTMSEQSLWTWFGDPPFSVAASAVITAHTVNPLTGASSNAVTIVCSSPYTRMNAVHRRNRNQQSLAHCSSLTPQ